jgi:hypothetical protein
MKSDTQELRLYWNVEWGRGPELPPPSPPPSPSDFPKYITAVLSDDGLSITLTYKSIADAADVVERVSFTVSDNTVTSIKASGSTVILTLATPILSGTMIVGATATTTPSPTTTSIDPTLVSISLSSDKVTLAYINAAEAAVAAKGTFTAAVDGVDVTITSTDVVGSTIVLTLAEPASGIITVTRTAPPNEPVNSGPVFVIATVGEDRFKVILKYDKLLDAVNKAAIGKFVVKVDGVNNAVKSTIVVGETVELYMTNAIAVGAVVTVSYTDPTTKNDKNAIQDIEGRDAASITNIIASDGDLTPPNWIDMTVEGSQITLTYNTAEEATNSLAGTFTATVNRIKVEIISSEAVDNKIILTLESEVPEDGLFHLLFMEPDITPPSFIYAKTNQEGDKVILIFDEYLDVVDITEVGIFDVKIVGYDIPVVSFKIENEFVTLKLEGEVSEFELLSTEIIMTIPDIKILKMMKSEDDLNDLILTFENPLEAMAATEGTFEVKVGSSHKIITGVIVIDNMVELSVSPNFTVDDVVKIRYIPPTKNDVITIQDKSGNKLVSAIEKEATNLVGAYNLPSISIGSDRTKVILTYDRKSSAEYAASKGGFVVMVNDVKIAVTIFKVVDNTVILTLATAVPNNSVVIVTSLSENLSLVDPVFISASTDVYGTSITLKYDKPLDANNEPELNQFLIDVQNVRKVIETEAISRTINLQLEYDVEEDDSITVDYNDYFDLLFRVSDQIDNSWIDSIVNSVNQITLIYDDEEAASAASSRNFKATVNGVKVKVTSINAVDNTLVLLLETVIITNSSSFKWLDIEFSDFSITLTYENDAIAATAASNSFNVSVLGSEIIVTENVANGSKVVLYLESAMPKTGTNTKSIKDEGGRRAPDLETSDVFNRINNPIIDFGPTGLSKIIKLSYKGEYSRSPYTFGYDIKAKNGDAFKDVDVISTVFSGELILTTKTKIPPGTLTFDDFQVTTSRFTSFSINEERKKIIVKYESFNSASSVVFLANSKDPKNKKFVVKINGVNVDIDSFTAWSIVTITLKDEVDSSALILPKLKQDPEEDAEPTFIVAETSRDGSSIVLVYDKFLSKENIAENKDFVVTVNNQRRVISADVFDHEIKISPYRVFEKGDIINLTYYDATLKNDKNAIQDTEGRDAANLGEIEVKNNVGGSIVSRGVDPKKIILTFIDPDYAAEAFSELYFSVYANDMKVLVKSVELSDSNIFIFLKKPVTSGSILVKVEEPPKEGAFIFEMSKENPLEIFIFLERYYDDAFLLVDEGEYEIRQNPDIMGRAFSIYETKVIDKSTVKLVTNVDLNDYELIIKYKKT